MIYRNCTNSLKDCVPLLTRYEALKDQFDWITDGSISHLVDENLPHVLSHLEMYLRLVAFFLLLCNSQPGKIVGIILGKGGGDGLLPHSLLSLRKDHTFLRKH
jgi:hypothetical protein